MTDVRTGPVFTEEYWKEPYDVLAELREHAPVREVQMPEGGTSWLITRYADVRAAFTDERLAKDWRATLPPEQRAAAPKLPGAGGDMMLLQDPPVHTRLRKLVAKAFTVRRIATLRPRIEEMAGLLLDSLPTDRPVDLVGEYAVPLPMGVICELLGVPAVDRDAFATWSGTMIDDHPDAEKQQASASLAAYLGELIEAKRIEPDDALISGLIQVSDEDGDRLTQDEIVAMGMLLLIAGHETTANLIANSVYAMLRDPSLRDRLATATDPAVMTGAVEEFLRWRSPVANAPLRFASEDIEVAGVTIPAGSIVTLSVAAANRDPQRFDAPELFEADRDTSGHVAFGHGLHYCLGASLARLEGEVALRALLTRYPGISAAVDLDDLVYRHSALVHALRELPVRLM